jgi:ligand-binding sensor domain-containing protein/two-component sensor histidine kinase
MHFPIFSRMPVLFYNLISLNRSATIFLFCIPFITQAQQQLVFEPVHDASGNSLPEVTFVYQDHTGFMWFGSTNGLYRYDGRKTIVFRHDIKNKNSIPSSNIWQVSEDSENRLWISTQKGVVMLDSGRKVFTSIFPEKDNAVQQRMPYTTALLIDKHDQLWFCSYLGLHHLNTKTGERKTFPIYDSIPYTSRHKAVGVIREDHDNLWLATTVGICRFNTTDLTWKYFLDKTGSPDELPLYNTIQDLLTENDTLMWASCWGGGIKKFDRIKETFQTHVYENHVPRHQWGTRNIAKNIVMLKAGHEKKYWVATLDRTLAQFDPTSGMFDFISDKNSKGFNAGSVNGIWYADGLMWVSTNTEFYKVNLEPPSLKPIRFDQLIKQQGKEVVHLASDTAREQLYIYTFSKELFRWDYKTNELNSIPISIKTTISLIHVLPDGKLLIGADGLYVFDPDKNSFEHINKDYGSERNVSYFKKGYYLITTFTRGVWLWCEGNNDLLPLITSQGESLTQKYPTLNHALVAHDRKIWLATHHDGLVCYDSATNKTKVYKATPEGIPLLIFYWIEEDEEGKIWASSSDGLICIDNGVIVKHYTTADGLPTDAVLKVLIRHNNVWIGTTRGLVHLDKVKNKMTTYSQQHGLDRYNLDFSDIALLSNSRIAIGESGRILLLDLDQQKAIQPPPKTMITTLLIAGKEQEMKKGCILGYQQNQLSFEFAAFNYATPRLVHYAYKLDGADRVWNYSGNTNSANYAGLTPGHYTLRVKGSNNGSLWSDESIFSFTIQPPVWQTVWFRALLIIAIACLAYIIYRYRINQLIKVHQMRNQIASDLHDDVGSAISSISLFAGMARMKQGKEVDELIEKIEETSRETINTMSDIVWSIEPANDNFQNVLRKMKQFGEQLAAPLNIAFRFSTDLDIEKLSLNMRQRKNIYLVYKESVSNACKHAQPTEISVTLQKNSKALVMTVNDNGRGFDANQESSGYGIGSMKARMTELNGKLEIISSTQEGSTRIVLTVPQ